MPAATTAGPPAHVVISTPGGAFSHQPRAQLSRWIQRGGAPRLRSFSTSSPLVMHKLENLSLIRKIFLIETV